MTAIPLKTKADVLQALAQLKDVEAEFWLGIPPERFEQPFGEAWSPADTVRHLIKSTVPIKKALKLPKTTLRVMFGKGKGISTSYGELVERYAAALKAGGKAGSFSPSAHDMPVDLVKSQKDLVTECGSEIEALARAVDPWSEKDLDIYRLPHPLLGKLTVREMLLFTLHHYEHHREIIAGRLGSVA